jgi:peroxiredoxin Q/BCP
MRTSQAAARKKAPKRRPTAKRAKASRARTKRKAAARRPRASRPKAAPAGARTRAPAPPAEGDRAPAFRLRDSEGREVDSASLAGRPYVLYFYPKDETPGCTQQACDFRDAHGAFEEAGVRILGVSPDPPESHARFRAHHGLPFTLLADAGAALARAYGAWGKRVLYGRTYEGVLRSTFLVDGAGVVRRAWRGVKVPGHVAAVREAAGPGPARG